MLRLSISLAACLGLAGAAVLPLAPVPAYAAMARVHHSQPEPPQDTGFLNRRVELRGVTYHFQVYLPEEWRRDDRKLWPIILFLHGRGERGSEGMWQTQVGLPRAVRDHPERWPFVIVMPQCSQANYWTDPEMMAMAMAALDRETEEFHGDPQRTYLTGLSLGGYGAWELARLYPRRWAAVAIAAGGIFWSYAPERWRQTSTLPAKYARPLAHTPVWLFHGSEDKVVPLRESELMFNAFQAAGGRIKLWIYQGLRHDCWTRAYDEPELPRWLLAHRNKPKPNIGPELPTLAERRVIPLHPTAIKLPSALLESLVGEYRDSRGRTVATVLRQGDQIYEKNLLGETSELAAESASTFFYPNGGVTSRLTVERDRQGRVTALVFRDDRHEERWERQKASSSR